jgi:hypothetical protein
VAEVVHLTAVAADDRLHALRAAPSWLEGRAHHLARVELNHLRLALSTGRVSSGWSSGLRWILAMPGLLSIGCELDVDLRLPPMRAQPRWHVAPTRLRPGATTRSARQASSQEPGKCRVLPLCRPRADERRLPTIPARTPTPTWQPASFTETTSRSVGRRPLVSAANQHRDAAGSRPDVYGRTAVTSRYRWR